MREYILILYFFVLQVMRTIMSFISSVPPAIMNIIFWNFITFQKSCVSPQVKRWLISSIKKLYLSCLMCSRMTQDQDLRKKANIWKMSELGGNRAQCPFFHPEIKHFQIFSRSNYQSILNLSNFACPGLQLSVPFTRIFEVGSRFRQNQI